MSEHVPQFFHGEEVRQRPAGPVVFEIIRHAVAQRVRAGVWEKIRMPHGSFCGGFNRPGRPVQRHGFARFEVFSALARECHRLDRHAAHNRMCPGQFNHRSDFVLVHPANHHIKQRRADAEALQVFQRPAFQIHHVLAMDFQRPVGPKRVKGKDDVNPKVGQRPAQVLVSRQTQAVRVHGHAPDFRPPAFLKQFHDVRMHRRFAASNVHQIKRSSPDDELVQQRPQFFAGHEIFPVRTVVSETDRAIHVARVGHGEHGQMAGVGVKGARSAIMRTAIADFMARKPSRLAAHGGCRAVQIPFHPIGNPSAVGSAFWTKPFLIHRAALFKNPCRNQRPAFAAHSRHRSQVGVWT